MQLENRVALITGAKRIGAAIARALAEKGADVAVSYNRSRDEAEACAEAVRSAGRRALVRRADLTNAADCDALVAAVVADLGRIDVLVNMASVYVSKLFDQLTERDWDANLDLDLKAAFLCARAAVPHMRATGGGRIVNFSDWVAKSGRPRYAGFLPYYVAKAGAIALTEALALEVAADQILVNAVAPGPILPPPGTSAEELAAVEQATPVGRWGGPAEIVKAVLALIESDFITGETVRVDGGRHLK
jgi:NAD(P)-dependent dehydrogenase (short-subunit alcohol dehydrogenase family)